jgi:uncharacterized membrane protein YphA (DoxX/SURF4 family)
MRIRPSTVVRVLLGGLFVVAGLNKLLMFAAPPLPEAAASFFAALQATGYFMPLLGTVEVVSGLLLISGQFVPLALVVLAPVVVNVAFFHALLAPDLVITPLVVGAELFLAWHHREAFEALLRRRSPHAQPVTRSSFTAREPVAGVGAATSH